MGGNTSACGCDVGCSTGRGNPQTQVLGPCTAGTCSNCTADRVRRQPEGVPIHAFYSLGAAIGRGTCGVVYRCRERRTGVTRACKTCTAKALGDSALLVQARTEVDILRLLQLERTSEAQSCFVRLFEVFEDDHALHLVMDICGGGELDSRQSECGSFSEAEAKVLFSQMVTAVRHVHKIEVAHRDLKLENWLFVRPAPSLDLRLCDFGLSIFLRNGAVATECVGSLYFVAPEVLGGAYDARADLWSLGVVAYMLLSGVLPFSGTKQTRIVASILRGGMSFDAPVWRTVSPQARNLIVKLLCVQPEGRPGADALFDFAWLRDNDTPLDKA